jgi:hypothetical protein
VAARNESTAVVSRAARASEIGPPVPDHLQIPRHDRERVVDLVRHARRQRPDRSHAVRDQQLLLNLALLGSHCGLAQLAFDGGR